MSLFLKIFLWFLLAVAMIVGVFVFITWTTQSEPFAKQWQNTIGDIMKSHAETATQIFESEGEAGLNLFLDRLANSRRINGIAYYENGKLISNKKLLFNADALVQKAINSETAEFESGNDEGDYVSRKIMMKSGGVAVLVAQWERPRMPIPFGPDWQTRFLRIGSLILMAGLVCWVLARYLTSPIKNLSLATKQLAGGDLKVRIGIKRRDEIGKLSRDFDEMAERIESLITSQERLTRDISHELRSPLARMNVALELAKNSPNSETFLTRIETESNRLNEMISNILTLSKLESKSETIGKQELNLTKLFENVVADAEFESKGKEKSVEVLKAEDCRIFGNERLIRSAIENVLRNAVRYTKDRVVVSLKRDGKTAVISIEDFGGGIPESDIKEIFRPFYRVSESRTRKSGGIGLGLAITEQAVQAHQGEVFAKNTENGLLVEIKLPTIA
jgi:two-component system, OmpR family, sensor histidine kinase CpxA